jgi:hypothetical protein
MQSLNPFFFRASAELVRWLDVGLKPGVSIPFSSGPVLNLPDLAHPGKADLRLNPFFFRASAEQKASATSKILSGLNPFFFRDMSIEIIWGREDRIIPLSHAEALSTPPRTPAAYGEGGRGESAAQAAH